jgi:nucleotide-binding universal stress UspA family protein
LQEQNMPRSDRSRDRGYQSILSAVDFSPQSSAALQMAAELAGHSGGHLTALYVEDPSVSLGAAAAGSHDHQLNEARKRLKQIADRVGAASRVVLGIPEDEIIAAASNMKAGLIVLALRPGRGLFGPRQGTTTYRILSASATPVLALPPLVNR